MTGEGLTSNLSALFLDVMDDEGRRAFEEALAAGALP
jgi:hypothetical protein